MSEPCYCRCCTRRREAEIGAVKDWTVERALLREVAEAAVAYFASAFMDRADAYETLKLASARWRQRTKEGG